MLADEVRARQDLELQTVELSITTYRCVPPDLRLRTAESAVAEYLDALNRTVVERMQVGGEAFVSNALLRGRYVLRSCVVNIHTRASDMATVADVSARLGRELDATMRPVALRQDA